MADLTIPAEDEQRDEASRSGRAALEAALERYKLEQRDAFWNAIGLYYSTRRHPGAGDSKPDAAPAAAA